MDITGLPKFTIRGEIRPAGGSFLSGAPSTSADDVRDFINANPEAKTLVFEISSFGGSLSQGFEMHDLMKNSGKKIVTIGYAVCSAAVLPFLAGSDRMRFVAENVNFVIHPARIAPENLGTESLTASDLGEIQQAIQMDDKKIMDAYCSVIGEDKRSKVLAYFSQETDLRAKGAISMGFANGYWKKKSAEPVKNALVFGVDAFTEERFSSLEISNYLNTKIMETKDLKAIQAKQSTIEKMLNTVRVALGLVKNDAILTDASGKVVGTIVSPDDNLQGKAAIAYDEAGLPTDQALPDGPYTDDKGRAVVVKGGIVESVAANAVPMDANKENEALKKEIADLKAAALVANTEKGALNKKVTDLEGANKTTLETVNAVKKEFDEFKKMVPGEKATTEETDFKIDKEAWKNMRPIERMHAMRMQNLSEQN